MMRRLRKNMDRGAGRAAAARLRLRAAITAAFISLMAPLAWGQTANSGSGSPAADDGKLSEIIVTAQRRSENLQNTPVAVTAVSGDDLAIKHVENITNISAITPSVNFQSANNAQAQSTIEIRGIGTVGNSRAFEGSVGVFVDGVYLSRAGQLLSNFLDIDTLQILRGPQGTLFGKNTTAGAILLTSVKPEFGQLNGTYEVTVGNLGTELVRVASNLPVSDTFALRFAGLFSNEDGYVKNPNSGDGYNDHRPRAFKAQALFQPSSNLSFRLIGDLSLEHDNCCYGTPLVIAGPVQPLINGLTAANGLRQASPITSDYQAVLNQNTDQQIRDRGMTLLSDWDISSSASLHAITAYRFWSSSQVNGDFDFSGADILNGDEAFQTHQFSQEFDFNGKVGETSMFKSLNYLVGTYFAHEGLLASRELFWGAQAQPYWDTLLGLLAGLPPGTAAAAPGLFSRERYPADDKSYAGFAHADIGFTDAFSGILGLRYTKEIKHGAFQNPFFDPAPNDVLVVLGVQPGPQFNAEHSDSALSGTAGLQYAFDTNKMGYLTFSRGFKAGGINLDNNAAGGVANNPALVPGAKPQDPTYKPETIDGWEAGFKSDYLDNTARTNVAAFYDKITDLQVAEFLGLQFTVQNAPSAKVYGAEVENTLRVTPEITLNEATTWLAHAAVDASSALQPPLSGGHRLQQAPNWASTLGADLNHPLSDRFALTARAGAQFTSRVYEQADTQTGTDIDQGAVTLLTAGLGIASLKNGWSVEAWCLNCADRRYETVVFPVPLQTGTYAAYVGAPRTFGVSLRGHF
jgi:iron complex outermembrane receptor protein